MKTEILQLIKEYYETGPVVKRYIVLPTGERMEKIANIAEELNFRKAGGDPDTDAALRYAENSLLDKARKIYLMTTVLMRGYAKAQMKGQIWSEHEKMKHWNDHYALMDFCLERLMEMGIIQKPNTTTIAAVEYHNGVEIGRKTFSEKELEKEAKHEGIGQEIVIGGQ